MTLHFIWLMSRRNKCNIKEISCEMFHSFGDVLNTTEIIGFYQVRINLSFHFSFAFFTDNKEQTCDLFFRSLLMSHHTSRKFASSPRCTLHDTLLMINVRCAQTKADYCENVQIRKLLQICFICVPSGPVSIFTRFIEYYTLFKWSQFWLNAHYWNTMTASTKTPHRTASMWFSNYSQNHFQTQVQQIQQVWNHNHIFPHLQKIKNERNLRFIPVNVIHQCKMNLIKPSYRNNASNGETLAARSMLFSYYHMKTSRLMMSPNT